MARRRSKSSSNRHAKTQATKASNPKFRSINKSQTNQVMPSGGF